MRNYKKSWWLRPELHLPKPPTPYPQKKTPLNSPDVLFFNHSSPTPKTRGIVKENSVLLYEKRKTMAIFP